MNLFIGVSMKSDAYEQTVKDNELVVGYALGYQQTRNPAYLLGAHTLLLPTSQSVISRVISDSGLPVDLHPDMLQDAYLRLSDAILCYNYARNPVFITYWRVTLRNHLIGVYRKQWRHKTIPEEYDPEDLRSQDEELNFAELEAKIRKLIYDEMRAWKSEKHIALAEAILTERVLRPKEEQTLHKDIALRFNLHPGVISQWELWMRDILLRKMGPDV